MYKDSRKTIWESLEEKINKTSKGKEKCNTAEGSVKEVACKKENSIPVRTRLA
jgi:hypothetical protein